MYGSQLPGTRQDATKMVRSDRTNQYDAGERLRLGVQWDGPGSGKMLQQMGKVGRAGPV